MPAIADGDYTVTAVIEAASGAVSDVSNTGEFTVDSSEIIPPEAPVIAIAEAEPDDLVNEAEASDGVAVQVSVPAGTAIGDLITVTLTQPNGADLWLLLLFP